MAQTKKDYYELLSVERSADLETVKKAYRRIALECHPDRKPGDKKAEERFKEVTEAYQILSDPQKRQIYDQYGHEGLSSSGYSGSSGGFADIFEDIFEDFFSAAGGSASGGGGNRRRRAQKGQDLLYGIEITFEEAARGVEKTIQLDREETCGTCKGDGSKPGTSRTSCPACHGSGQVLASSGFFSISRPCQKCHGEGSLSQHPCGTCRGLGRVGVTRKLQVRVPGGVDEGLRLRMPGEGSAGLRGGPRGDLYIDIHMHAHEFFTREKDDLICEVPISFAEAALGCDIDVPTLKSTASLKVPAGTQTGKEFRLKGKGFPSLAGHGAGDEVIKIFVETPMHLSDKQKQLLKEFAALSEEKVNPASSSFMQKVRNFFLK